MSRRKILDEMLEAVAAMKSRREGKITLRTYNVEATSLPKVDSKLIRDTRKRLHCSRACSPSTGEPEAPECSLRTYIALLDQSGEQVREAAADS